MLSGPPLERDHGLLARWIFLRALGLIFLIAFASLWGEIDGLIGSRGVLPIADFLEAVRSHYGSAIIAQLPTLCWWNASDGFLHLQCALGCALSIALVIGIAPRACIFLAWAVYLSLTVAGQDFFNFQWDALLLETAVFAFFYAPGNLRPGLAREKPPSRAALFSMRWLLFRLMFASGAVKLASGDVTWSHLSALTVHYQTQPLPMPLAWHAHQLPEWFQRASCAIMFAIELFLPWLAFAPRRLRIFAFSGLVFLQGLILLTGNYGFFNLLSIALCLPLLDDDLLSKVLPKRFADRALRSAIGVMRSRGLRLLLATPAVCLVAFTSLQLLERLDRTFEMPALLDRAQAAIAPLRSLNTYGLFAVMTTHRREIAIEGSRDGVEWREYVFRHKPGDVARAPDLVAPHMPRLDWQMWFAALGRARDNDWFQRLMVLLLERSPPVLDLFAEDPFQGEKPAQVRAVLYEYRFTTRAERALSGAVWVRTRRGLYASAMPPGAARSTPR